MKRFVSTGRKFFPAILCVLAILMASPPCDAAPDTPHLNIIQVQDTINPGVEDFIKVAINRSQEEGAECLIILLDTPGGLMSSMRAISQDILNAEVPIVVFVYPQGAQAASAGVFRHRLGRHSRHGPGHQYRRGPPGHGFGRGTCRRQ